MRDPKIGFVAMQALAPAIYSSGNPMAGSYRVEDEARAINKSFLDDEPYPPLNGLVTPGQPVEFQNCSDALLIVHLGSSVPDSDDQSVHGSVQFGFGIRLQREQSYGSELWEDCTDLSGPYPENSTWCGWRFLKPGRVHKFKINIRGRRYRPLFLVKDTFSVSAGALCVNRLAAA